MVYKNRGFVKAGFTIIELVMVILILAILAVPGAYLLGNLVHNSVYIPSKLNMDMLASEAIDIMIEGDSQAKGLRFSRVITAAQDNLVTFINQDGITITYSLDTLNNRLYRSIGGGPLALIPYYITAGVSVLANGPRLFTYYDTGDSPTNTATAVRRIAISLIARTGSGSYNNWEGQSQQISSVAVKRLQ